MIADVFWGIVQVFYGILIVACALLALLLVFSLSLGVVEGVRKWRRGRHEAQRAKK